MGFWRFFLGAGDVYSASAPKVHGSFLCAGSLKEARKVRNMK
jgi:hypothetical protein